MQKYGTPMLLRLHNDAKKKIALDLKKWILHNITHRSFHLEQFFLINIRRDTKIPCQKLLNLLSYTTIIITTKLGYYKTTTPWSLS